MTTSVCCPRWLPGVAELRSAVCVCVCGPQQGGTPAPPWPHPGAALVQAMNVLGGPLQCCCKQPLTGYYRDGFCRTGGGDFGAHVVCAQVRAREQHARSAVHRTEGRQLQPHATATCTDWSPPACPQVTEEFLEYTAARGNDLSTPISGMFPGLKPGDKWCLCASR